MMVLPFQETKQSNYFIREFSSNLTSFELVWHRDRTSRTVHILKGQGWKLQFDDKLPEELDKKISKYLGGKKTKKTLKRKTK